MSYGAQGFKGCDDNDDYDDDDNDDDCVNCTVNNQMVFFFRRPNIANSKRTKLSIYLFFPNATICPLWIQWPSLLGMTGV